MRYNPLLPAEQATACSYGTISFITKQNLFHLLYDQRRIAKKQNQVND